MVVGVRELAAREHSSHSGQHSGPTRAQLARRRRHTTVRARPRPLVHLQVQRRPGHAEHTQRDVHVVAAAARHRVPLQDDHKRDKR